MLESYLYLYLPAEDPDKRRYRVLFDPESTQLGRFYPRSIDLSCTGKLLYTQSETPGLRSPRGVFLVDSEDAVEGDADYAHLLSLYEVGVFTVEDWMGDTWSGVFADSEFKPVPLDPNYKRFVSPFSIMEYNQ